MIEPAKINLDDPEVYRRLDPAGMLVHLHRFPDLCRQAWSMARSFRLPEDYRRVKKVVVLGMGGSAIGGDLVGSLAINEAAVPVLVCRDYALPRYADADTLIIASSYSGMTEETLSAFKQACDTPAKKLAVTTGGKLKELCQKMGVPVFTFDYQTQPRAALPFSFFMTLGILHNLGIFRVREQDLEAALSCLEALAAEIVETVPTAQNQAKLLAEKLPGRLAVIYGAGITAEVAHRWKTQFNENSKTMCFYEVFSELNHNAIVGYSFPGELVRQAMVILLDSELLHPRIHIRYEVTQNLLEQSGISYQVVRRDGANALGQMLCLVLLGDYVSYYLGLLNRTDPTPVKAIDFLKNSLAQH